MLEILATGPGMTLQDFGRPGWRRYGLPAGGAMDSAAMALANQLLGNPSQAPVLEVFRQGARIRIAEPTWLALAGAGFCSGVPTPSARLFHAGEVLVFDQNVSGCFAYLAVPGGFLAKQWFGSAASDPRNGLGPVLQKDDCLTTVLRQPNISTQGVARRLPAESPRPLPTECTAFQLYRGPQYEAFTESARRSFIETEWTVSPRSDRCGYRLEGADLEVPESIPSGPVLPGSFQVTGGGKPIITMPDGPTVGGYAQIAVLPAAELGLCAQCAPGAKLHFSWIN
ncbi:MAG: biotin-dependent carboxyltransferase [Puniceicoccaceae bacterium]|nr:MAG: biotin-dependent carboxyltransferase [Puniceicoccaceae bacterium]